MLLGNSSMKSSANASYGKDQISCQERPIDEALTRLDERLDVVNSLLSELSDRLNPVSRERCPEPDEQKAGRLATWLCNHEIAKAELTDGLGCYSYMGIAPGEFEINGKLHVIADPKGGRVMGHAHD